MNGSIGQWGGRPQYVVEREPLAPGKVSRRYGIGNAVYGEYASVAQHLYFSWKTQDLRPFRARGNCGYGEKTCIR